MKVRKTVMITFSVRSEKFDSNYERNKFFRGLYGWKQIIPKENKRYEYHRSGILDDIPHMKVDQSSFIVPEDNFDEITDFFEEWTDKVIWKTFKVLLDKNIEKGFEKWEDEDG